MCTVQAVVFELGSAGLAEDGGVGRGSGGVVVERILRWKFQLAGTSFSAKATSRLTPQLFSSPRVSLAEERRSPDSPSADIQLPFLYKEFQKRYQVVVGLRIINDELSIRRTMELLIRLRRIRRIASLI